MSTQDDPNAPVPPTRAPGKQTFKVGSEERERVHAAMEHELSRELALMRVFDVSTPLTTGLIALIVALFLGAFVYGDQVLHGALGLSVDRLAPVELAFLTGMKLHAHILDEGQWWRLCSSVFVHLSFLHLGFNAYALWALGPHCERFYGKARFLILFLGSGVAASLASLAYTQAPSGGASGAIFGLLGALLVFGYKYREAQW